MRVWQGTVSKALLMSIATMTVRRSGDWLKPSMIFWVRFLSRIVVEWFPLKPCWEGDSGRCSLILFKISFSSTLDTVVSREMGR